MSLSGHGAVPDGFRHQVAGDVERMSHSSDIVERGDIYFLYRPRVEQEQVREAEDVQRLFLVLQPVGGGPTRRIVIGRKRLPAPEEHERFWGFVEEVSHQPRDISEDFAPETYGTRTRGERELPAARPAGEGRYAFVAHDDHTHLAYQLELPERPRDVQDELEIEPEASYIVAVKNPDVPSPPGAGLASDRRAELPDQLQERFEGRRFIGVAPDLLDHESVEIVLIGAADDAERELGIHLDTSAESLSSAEVFKRLQLPREEHPTEPLSRGEWR